LPSSQELEAQGARIGTIRIVVGDVFATELPEENNNFFRLANHLHIETKPSVIRRQLLFKEGDAYVDRLLRESERNLRRNRYLYSAEVIPTAVHDGVVDLEVRTRDVWTFKPGIEYGRTGGTNSSGFELQESNLFGYGKELTVAHRTDVDRTSDEFRYFDPQLIGSHAQFLLSHSTNSDGKRDNAYIDRPFYAIDSHWSAIASALDWERTDQRYTLGHVADEFRHHQESYQLGGGVSNGLQGNWVRRYTYGASYMEDRFGPTNTPLSASEIPADRKFVYPFVGFTLFENKFEERLNENQIERTEDLYAGKYLQGSLGWASERFGSLNNAAIVTLGAGNTIELRNRRHTIVLQSDASSRIEDGELRNAVLNGASRYYWRFAERQLFYASLSGSLTRELDTDHQLTLGGDSGLRGYPLRYQEGSAAALLTLEERIYTKYYLFRIFHLGGAIFADAGRTWGHGNAPPVPGVETNLGLLRDIGIGLRFGASRSAFGNVIHVDLAYPLDGDKSIDKVQFIVETKASF
jgi:outer membrane protein assembly factor BamA